MPADAYAKPTKRRLRVFAFDPAASVQLETAVINDSVIELPWERPWEDELAIGPTNDYLEVIDYDPSCRTFYEPLNLNEPWLLAQDGLPPAEGNPQFHQQMVFAVAMKTIRLFEAALGRPVFWSIPDDDPRVLAKKNRRPGAPDYPPFIKRLRIYPHALREANAYYSPAKGALLFGYFKAPPRFAGDEGEWVFTCLSQDIVAHETAHAILHGMRRRSIEPTNPDSLAFHEAFADIVALMQHFTMDGVVRHELTRTGGMLRSVNLLTGLASQFGHATGRGGALRMALETLRIEQTEREAGKEPVTRTLKDAVEPHDRGQFLVAAIFDTFVTIYERRTLDLFRMAGARPGDDRLPEQLIARLAAEAAKVAQSVLSMCVRGLDYLPPADAGFGDYLRAVITADTDLVPNDRLNYRVALAESFRKREIPVPGCMSYAPASLCWESPDLREFEALIVRNADKGEDSSPDMLFAAALRDMTLYARINGSSTQHFRPREEDPRFMTRESELNNYVESSRSTYVKGGMDARNLREEAMRVVMRNQRAMYNWLISASEDVEVERMWEALLGLRTLPLGKPRDGEAIRKSPKSISARSFKVGDLRKARWPRVWRDAIAIKGGDTIVLPSIEVHSVRVARRAGPGGNGEVFQLIVQITQRRRGYFNENVQKRVDENGPRRAPAGEDGKPGPDLDPQDFWFRGGATIIVDLRDGRLQRIIRQRIDNEDRLARQRSFILGDSTALAMTAAASEAVTNGHDARVTGFEAEPFAFMHGEMR
jgi:hypothetical protein